MLTTTLITGIEWGCHKSFDLEARQEGSIIGNQTAWQVGLERIAQKD